MQIFKDHGVMFANFLRPGADDVLYEEVRDVDRMVKLLGDYMDEYNETHHAQVPCQRVSLWIVAELRHRLRGFETAIRWIVFTWPHTG